MEKMMKIDNRDVLIVVDMQNDFFNDVDGSLPVSGAEKIINTVNKTMDLFDRVVATRDWHPIDHCSFETQNGPWPIHCVAGTFGAEYHPDFNSSKVNLEVRKGFNKDVESYSPNRNGILDLYRGFEYSFIKRIFICGVALDYCVKETALEAVYCGLPFEVYIISDACQGVTKETSESAMLYLQNNGVNIVNSCELTR
jgi:nicotinamidase/pyrazinamidase